MTRPHIVHSRILADIKVLNCEIDEGIAELEDLLK
jgi:hypothetical protein